MNTGASVVFGCDEEVLSTTSLTDDDDDEEDDDEEDDDEEDDDDAASETPCVTGKAASTPARMSAWGCISCDEEDVDDEDDDDHDEEDDDEEDDDEEDDDDAASETPCVTGKAASTPARMSAWGCISCGFKCERHTHLDVAAMGIDHKKLLPAKDRIIDPSVKGEVDGDAEPEL